MLIQRLPWRLYQHYNDTKIVQEHYLGVQGWIDYLTTRARTSGLASMYYFYGDWETPVNYPPTNSSLVSAFSYLSDVQTMITLSKILNNQTNVDKYTQLYNQLTEEFHTSFYNSTLNGYAGGHQTENVLALKLPNVVPSNLRPTVIKSLVDDIVKNGNHSTSGIIGCAAIYPVLSDSGYHDLAVTIATQTTYPPFGYMFNNNVQNATTIWESFHSLLPGQPAQDSLNHHMLNTIGAWFYRYLAGIQLNGFADDLTVHPRLTTLLTNIDAEVHTIFGPILVSWQQNTEDHSVIYNITVPNTLYSIITFEPISPSAHCISIEEGQTLVWDQSSSILKTELNGIDWIRTDSNIPGAMKVRVQGGSYHWKIQWD